MSKATKKTKYKIDSKTGYPFGKGDAILIRTVTMYQVGRVEHIGVDSITLSDASWVADIGRLSEALKNGTFNEVEKCPAWACIGRGAIVDVFPWEHALPESTK